MEFEDIEKPETSRSVQIPPWMVQDKVSFWEKVEIKLFQLISIFPVFVTFGLYTYFLVFYVGVSVLFIINIGFSFTYTLAS
jgi:hypothetical protein